MKSDVFNFLLFVILLTFLLAGVNAELSLVVSGESKEGKADFFLQTNPNADTSFDAYDLEYPPFPVSLPKIYSVVGNKKMIMDSWSNSDRTIKFVYEKANDTKENLELLFTGEVAGTYKIILKDYGNDQSYKQLKSSTLIEDGKKYNSEITSEQTYFELMIDYLFCGDGICSEEEDETCITCSADCTGECEGESVEITDSLNPYHFLTVSELENGYTKEFKLDTGYKLNYLNKTYTFSLSSISTNLITLTSEEHYIELFNGANVNVDLNQDTTNELEFRASDIKEDRVTISVKAININGFSEVPPEDRTIKLKKEISVFDERYQENTGFSTIRIVLPIVLLFVGVSMFIFGLFLLLKKHMPKEETEQVEFVQPGN